MTVPTWRATSGGVAYASGKSMLDVFNGSSSVKNIDVVRCYLFNNGTSAVTGVLTTMQIRRLTAATGGSTVTPIKHRTASAALDANTTAATGATVTATDIFRRILWSNDEPVVSGSTMDEWELLVPFAEIWNAGYGDSNVEPIRCVAGSAQGVDIAQSGVSAVGSADLEIEFLNN